MGHKRSSFLGWWAFCWVGGTLQRGRERDEGWGWVVGEERDVEEGPLRQGDE